MKSFLSIFSCQSNDIDNPINTKEIKSNIKTNKNQQSSIKKNSLNLSNQKNGNSKQQIKQRKMMAEQFQFQNRMKKEQEQEIIMNIAQKLKNKPPSQRKQIEVEFIKQNNKQFGQFYIIQKKWWDGYSKYLQDSVKQSFNPIDNKLLLQKKSIKNGYKQQQHYTFIHKNIWIFLCKLYGGGPPLKKDTHLPITNLSHCKMKKNIRIQYFNVCIQSLLSVGELCYYFLNKIYNQIIFQTKYSKKTFCITTHRNVISVKDNPNKTKDLEDFQYLFQQKFVDGKPHAPIDLIEFYFQNIQHQLNPMKIIKFPQAQNSQQGYLNYKITHNSIVNHLFSGQITNIFKCLACNNISVIYQPFFSLKIEIYTGRNTLEGNLNKYFLQKKLNDYSCERCRYKTKATRQCYISYSPEYLYISLNRFVNLKYVQNNFVAYPFVLNLAPYFEGIQQKINYSLQSIIVYEGQKLSGGSYYIVTRRQGKWYYMKNEETKQISQIKDYAVCNAFILVYNRMQ